MMKRHSDPAHARIRRAELTEEGTRTLRASAREIERLSDELLESVPAGDRDAVRRGLVAVMNRLSSGF